MAEQPANPTHRPLAGWQRAVVGAAGAGIVLLSVVPAWLHHVRNVGGHGLTAISVTWSAWEGRAWPFLPLAVVLAGAVAVLALVGLRWPDISPRRLLASASVLVLGLLLGAILPLDRTGYASRVQIDPVWALPVAAALGLLMVAVTLPGARRRAALLVGAAAVIVLSAATYGGRVVALDLAEGNPRHYSDGTYIREATDGQPAETLTIRDGKFSVGGRWSGIISGRGLVAVLTDDPDCPTDRGAYRVFAAGEQDIRWNLIVDLCADGERGRDLTTGIWRRQP